MDTWLLADPDPVGCVEELAGNGCDCGSCDVACGKLNGGSCNKSCCGMPWTSGDSGTATYLMSMLVLTPAMARPRPAGRWPLPRRLGMLAIRGYQRWLSARLPTRCRYVPSCSHYGLEAVRRYGLVRGSRIALGRILRCNPDVPRGTSDPLQPQGPP